jgi:menaquinone-9 beta-reductase
VQLAGPLASFDGADTWVEHPYRQGVALIGDAAASNDPSFGQGLSLTLRDVRVLRDQLLSSNDSSAVTEAYAEEHDSHYGVIHQASRCFGQMFYDASEASRQLRARALPRIVQDPTRVPDQLVSGPEVPLDETAIRRFFGEE